MPLVFVSIWAASMELSPTSLTSTMATSECSTSRMEEDSCWSGWSQSPHLFYLIAAPMLVAYAVSSEKDETKYVQNFFSKINLIFLLNIVRILVSKLQADSTPNVDQVR